MDNIGVRGLFGRGCDSEILFFIILFLLLFCDNRCMGRYGRYCN